MQVDSSVQRPLSSVTEAPSTPLKGDVAEGAAAKPKTQEQLNQPFQEARQKQDASPEMYAVNEQTKTPEIADTTKNTCADALVMQYQTLITSPNIPPKSWYPGFQQVFEAKFKETNPDKDPRQATQEDLKQFAMTLANEERFQAWGIKVAEDMQVLMEGGFGAKIDPLMLPERVGFESRNKIMDAEGNMAEATADVLKDATSLPQRLLASVGIGRNSEAMKKQRQKQEIGRVLDDTNEHLAEEGGRQRNMINNVDFKDFTYNEGFQIDGKPLNDVQKTFLRRMSGVNDGQPLQNVNLQQISNLMENITLARRNFYAHHDRQLTSNNDFVFLKRDSKNPNEFSYNTPSANPTVLLEKMGFTIDAGSRPEVSVGISALGVEGQLKIIQGAIQEEIKKSLEEAVEGEKAKTTTALIDARIATLTAELGKPLDETVEKKLNEELTQLRKDLQAAQDVEAKEKEMDETIETMKKEKDSIIADNSIDTTPGGDIEKYDTWIDKKNQLAKVDKEITDAKARYNEIAGMIAQLPKKKTERFDPKTGKVIESIEETDPKYKTVEEKYIQELSAAQTEYITKTGELSTAKQELATAEEAIPQDKREAVQKLKDHETKITKKTKDKDQYRGAKGNPKKSEDIQKEIDAKTDELNGKRFDARFTQQRLDAYTELKNRMDAKALLQINQRAMQPHDSIQVTAQLEEAAAMHPDVPTAYLRAIHILYGPEVTMLTADGIKAYERATKLLSPEKFIQALKQKDSATFGVIQNPYDRDHMDPDAMLAAVEGDFITELMKTFQAEVRSDELGKASQIEQDRIRDIRATNVPEQIKPEQLAAEANLALAQNVDMDQARTVIKNAGINTPTDVRQIVDTIMLNNAADKDKKDTITELQGIDSSITDSIGDQIVENISKLPPSEKATVSFKLMQEVMKKGLSAEEAAELAAIASLVPPDVAQEMYRVAFNATDVSDIIKAIPNDAQKKVAKDMATELNNEITTAGVKGKKKIDRRRYLMQNADTILEAVGKRTNNSISADAAKGMKQLINTEATRATTEIAITEMGKKYYQYNTAEDLALKITNDWGGDPSNYPRAKMLALEIIKRKQKI